jgi:hypothetical protein
MHVFVQNVSANRERGIAPLAEPPSLTFTQNASGRFGGRIVHRDGQDYSSDGHDADDRTPGDPAGPPRFGSVNAGGFGGIHRSSGDYLDGGGDDGTTPGDPRVTLPPPRSSNTRRFRPPINDADSDTFNPRPPKQQTIFCPSCGYTFSPTDERQLMIKPLGTPTMNFAMRSRKPTYVASGSDPDDFSDQGDDGRALDWRRTDSVMPSEHQCPNCGSVFVGPDEIGDGGTDQRAL